MVAAGTGRARREGRGARWCTRQQRVEVAGRPIYDPYARRRGRRRCADWSRGSHLEVLPVELMTKLIPRLIVDRCGDRSDVHSHETEASRPRGVAIIHDLAHFYFVGRVLRLEVPAQEGNRYIDNWTYLTSLSLSVICDNPPRKHFAVAGPLALDAAPRGLLPMFCGRGRGAPRRNEPEPEPFCFLLLRSHGARSLS